MRCAASILTTALLAGLLLALSAARADPTTQPANAPKQPPAGVQTIVYRVVGLFAPDREADLRKAAESIPGVRVAAVNFDRGEATFEFDPAVAFKGTAPDKLLEHLDERVRNASGQLFRLRQRSETPPDQLATIDVTVAPLDCRACALGVHEIVCNLAGVLQAAVDMKDGHIHALVDPDMTSREKIRAALKAREVNVEEP